MKYCPYCGAELIDSTASFCSECGKTLKKSKGKPKPDKKESSKRKRRKKHIISAKNADDTEIQEKNIDSGYDGYYDDICPIDESVEHQGLDKSIIKNIIIIIVGVLLAISICVAAMYFL